MHIDAFYETARKQEKTEENVGVNFKTLGLKDEMFEAGSGMRAITEDCTAGRSNILIQQDALHREEA
jgi:hypothetical protein